MPAGPGNLPDPPDPASPTRLRAFNAAGQLIADSGVRLNQIGHAPAYAFAAGFPGSAARIELVSAGTVLAAKQRSRPPTVRLTAPRHRATVGKRLEVSWIASDPDHDPLMASVDYSSDGGRTWRHVLRGPSTGRASIPGRYLEGSDRGRVRVSVNDGFSDATALSADSTPQACHRRRGSCSRRPAHRFRPDPRAYRGRARRPRGSSACSGADVVCRLTAGRHRGAAERTAAGGRVTLRLVARDSRKRVAVVTRRLIVAPAALRLLSLRTPAHVGPHADTPRDRACHHRPRDPPRRQSPLPRRAAQTDSHNSAAPTSEDRNLQLTITISTNVAGQAALHERIVLLRA